MRTKYKYVEVDTGKELVLDIRPPYTTIGRVYKLEIDGCGVMAVMYQGEV